jgi:hypothetical protein
MSIRNDGEFKTALHALDPVQQRRLAARFVQRVLDLCGDVRVRASVEAALHEDLPEAEREVLCQAAKAARVESFTQCGHKADWSAQAGHFVATAALNCVQAPTTGADIAWDAAMHARMARTCESVAKGVGTATREAEAQYAMLDELMHSRSRGTL